MTTARIVSEPDDSEEVMSVKGMLAIAVDALDKIVQSDPSAAHAIALEALDQFRVHCDEHISRFGEEKR